MFDYFDKSNSELVDLVINKFKNLTFDDNYRNIIVWFLEYYDLVKKEACIQNFIYIFLGKIDRKPLKSMVIYEILGYVYLIKEKIPLLTYEELFMEFPDVKECKEYEMKDILHFYSALRYMIVRVSSNALNRSFIINTCCKFEPTMFLSYCFGGAQTYHTDIRRFIFSTLIKRDNLDKKFRGTQAIIDFSWPSRTRHLDQDEVDYKYNRNTPRGRIYNLTVDRWFLVSKKLTITRRYMKRNQRVIITKEEAQRQVKKARKELAEEDYSFEMNTISSRDFGISEDQAHDYLLDLLIDAF